MAYHSDQTATAASSPRRLLACTALGLVLTCPGLEAASQPAPLPPISIEGQRPADEQTYKAEQAVSPKYTEPLLDTPQTITVIPTSTPGARSSRR